jgi:CRISPR-associated protein Cas5t
MVKLYVEAPLASWRAGYARQYWETYPVPPPSTIYGMLLSLVGEEQRAKHEGCRVAMAMLSEPWRSRVLRTVWKVDDRRTPPGVRPNVGPEWQEILADVRVCVWVDRGRERGRCLRDRLLKALHDPVAVDRHGGLSFGESTFLVNQVRLWRPGDPSEGRMVIRAHSGETGLVVPVWADHVGSLGTRAVTVSLTERGALPDVPPEDSWIEVARA